MAAVRPVSYSPADNDDPLVVPVQATAPGGVFPPPPGVPAPGAPSAEPYNCGVVGQPPPPAAGGSFWDKCKGIFGSIPGLAGPFDSDSRHHLFESDQNFNGFISPVSNPFYFEDPRALTEVRPIFMWQTSPSSNPVFGSGNVEFFGIQARLAITEQFSVVINKLGGIWQQPDTPTPEFGNNGGFAEIWLGPKYTFLRCDSTGTLGAVGLTFQLPVGSGSVQQDTGDLSLVPYVSFAQSFLKSSYGTFNAMATLGYDFRLDNARTESFFTSWHLDYDVGNLHRIYPLIEINWFHYTVSGKVRPLTFDGRDLFNLGSEFVAGQNEASIALGARYKFKGCEAVQLGFAVELPISGNKGMDDFRMTIDMIFRY
jgi:hypothetical protein